MVESDNGERDQPKPKRHNAKLRPFAIRQRIVNALANGDSQRSIARALRVSPSTVSAVAAQEWEQVETRKQRLAAQAERNALMAGEQIAEALEQRKFPIGSLVPVYGVSVDKSLSLKGDSIATIQHLHTHRLSSDDVYAFALERSKRCKDGSLQQEKPSRYAETHLLAEKTQGKKKVKA